jgi:hypothetical protein
LAPKAAKQNSMKIKKIIVLDRYLNNIQAAVTDYVKLQHRETHPDGTFDKKKRWEPDRRFCCCQGIRTPSAAYPFSLLIHARTAEHVFHQHGVTGIQLNEFKALCRCAKKLTALDAATAAAVTANNKISVQFTLHFNQSPA